MQSWSGKAYPTLVGSMPHRDADKAIDLILRSVPHIPVWPQLSAFRAEQMMIQYLEGLPGVDLGSDRIRVRFDAPDFEAELYSFYEEYLEVEGGTKDIDDSRFSFGMESGRTFRRFIEVLRSRPGSLTAVKGQVVGPFTLLAGLKDERDRLVLYDDRMQDVVAKHLAMKCRWQIKHLKEFDCPVIVFLDEPALAGFGSSAFISIAGELVQRLLQEVIESVHAEGGLAGIHICANTEWMLAFESRVDIINFDAYSYFDRFALYKDALMSFIDRGGNVAWGVVPTSDPELIRKETPENLVDRWFENIKSITAQAVPVERILNQSLFTPSCGCGSLSESLAERVLEMTDRVSRTMRSHL